MWEDGRTNVPAIHDNAFIFSHLLLLSHGKLPYSLDSRYLAHFFGNHQVPDDIFHILSIEPRLGLSRFMVGYELEHDMPKRVLHSLGMGPVHVITKEIKRNGAVHGATVDILILQLTRQLFCQCALPRRAPPVDSDDDLFHLRRKIQKRRLSRRDSLVI